MSEKEIPEEKANTKSVGPGYIEVIVIALLVAAGAVFGYDTLFAQKVKVVDLKGYIRTQEALMRAGEITEKQLQARFDKVDTTLVQEAAAHKNQVILLKEVVLKNGKEISIQ